MRFLALDLGSTYTKAALMEDGTLLRQHSVLTPAPSCTQCGRYEIDANEYSEQVQAILSALWEEHTDALLISTQMHGYVLTDDDFHPLSPYVSWRDGLGVQQLSSIRLMLGDESTAPSGVPLKGNLALCALTARKLLCETPSPHARLCTLGGYIIGRLTGAYVCHMTNAAPLGLADIRNGCWNTGLLEKAGLDLQLPRVVNDLQAVGSWRGMAVYPDLGDQQVCAAGADLEPEKSLHISIGTAGLIGGLTAHDAVGAYESRPWIMPGLFLRTISGLPGGRHLAGLVHLIQSFAAQFGEALPESCIWGFLSSCTPCAEAGAFDAWQRLSLSADKWVAALYADMAAAYANAASGLKLSVQHLAFSGGAAAKNPALRSAICRAFHCDASKTDNDAMRGLAAIAAILDA